MLKIPPTIHLDLSNAAYFCREARLTTKIEIKIIFWIYAACSNQYAIGYGSISILFCVMFIFVAIVEEPWLLDDFDIIIIIICNVLF